MEVVLSDRFVGLMFLVLALSTNAAAVDYYVDANASGSNDGTSAENAWKSFADVDWSSLKGGDNVFVANGTYSGRVRLSNIMGESGSKITIKAINPVAVTMEGFTINDSAHLRIEGFAITNSLPGWDEGHGVFVNESNDIEIVNNYIYDIKRYAVVGWKGSADSIYVADNRMYKIQMGVIASGTDWVVENNEIERLYDWEHLGYPGGDCDYARFGGPGHIFRNNYFHGTLHEEIGNAHVDGFQTFYNAGSNVLIENNFVTDFHQGLMASAYEHVNAHSITLKGNVFANGWSWGASIHTITNIVAENNTFYNTGAHGIGIRDNGSGYVENNIFLDTGTSYWGASTLGDYNIVFNARAPGVQGENDLVDVDPLVSNVNDLVGPDGVPFTQDDGLVPRKFSPAYAGGNNGTDIGAYGCIDFCNTTPVETGK